MATRAVRAACRRGPAPLRLSCCTQVWSPDEITAAANASAAVWLESGSGFPTANGAAAAAASPQTYPTLAPLEGYASTPPPAAMSPPFCAPSSALSSPMPPPPTVLRMALEPEPPLVAIDCANVAAAHQPRDGGYLNIEAVEVALKHFMGHGYNVRALLPSVWMQGTVSVSLDSATAAQRRGELRELMADGMAEIAQEPSADRPEDPLMQWAVAERAILVTNRKFGDQLSAYQVPAQREACREWSRSWVWNFSFLPRAGRLEFVPSTTFVTPRKPIAGVESLFDVLATSFSEPVTSLFVEAGLRGVEEQASAPPSPIMAPRAPPSRPPTRRPFAPQLRRSSPPSPRRAIGRCTV